VLRGELVPELGEVALEGPRRGGADDLVKLGKARWDAAHDLELSAVSTWDLRRGSIGLQARPAHRHPEALDATSDRCIELLPEIYPRTEHRPVEHRSHQLAGYGALARRRLALAGRVTQQCRGNCHDQHHPDRSRQEHRAAHREPV